MMPYLYVVDNSHTISNKFNTNNSSYYTTFLFLYQITLAILYLCSLSQAGGDGKIVSVKYKSQKYHVW